jgi:hypothetical protein
MIAIAAVTAVTAFAIHRVRRSRPARSPDDRGNATGIAGRTSTRIANPLPGECVIFSRPSVDRFDRRHESVGRTILFRIEQTFCKSTTIVAAIGGRCVNEIAAADTAPGRGRQCDNALNDLERETDPSFCR